MSKTVVILVGPKGAGKTHIGSVLEKCAGIRFLPVEAIWLGLSAEQDGWSVVENAIDACLRESDVVVIESLGGSEGFERLRSNLGHKYRIQYVRVTAPLDVCASRVRNRDNSSHIRVSDEQVAAYNRIAAGVNLPWDLELTNEPPLSDKVILELMRGFLTPEQSDTVGAG